MHTILLGCNLPTRVGNWVGNREKGLDEKDLAIIRELKKHPEGLGFNELAEKLKDTISRPTLRRRIKKLKDAGLIIVSEKDWRRGKKKIISPISPHETEMLLKIEDIKWKALYYLKLLKYEASKGIISAGEDVDRYD